MKIRLILKPAWSSVVNAIGGGPVLVRSGKPVFRANEDFTPDQLLPRTARTAVGQLADGHFLLVTVDGSQPGYSAGVTNFELALLMVKLGAVTAAALDGGGSAAMAFDGQLLSTPLGAERPIGDALLASYGGVYVPPPLEPVLSPNGDGIADKQRLAYKVVRPSTVTANLLGPDGVPRFTFSGPVEPGTYPLDWPGTKPDGTPEAEGRWRWVVSATDDQERDSSIERAFWVNDTLGFLRVSPRAARFKARRRNRVVARFRLTHTATVVGTVRTRTGVLVRRLGPVRLGAGTRAIRWDGRYRSGRLAYRGSYVFSVFAKNAYGPVTLAKPFGVRR